MLRSSSFYPIKSNKKHKLSLLYSLDVSLNVAGQHHFIRKLGYGPLPPSKNKSIVLEITICFTFRYISYSKSFATMDCFWDLQVFTHKSSKASYFSKYYFIDYEIEISQTETVKNLSENQLISPNVVRFLFGTPGKIHDFLTNFIIIKLAGKACILCADSW